jgi:enamine deaminase RidA (YjgF/YER057c/UK114 family)
MNSSCVQQREEAALIERYELNGRMSQIVVHRKTVYLSGQVAAPGASIREQAAAVLGSIDRLLAQAGSNRSKLLSATICLADMGDFDEMNAVWEAWIDPANPPARATIECRLATPDYRIEIIAVAAQE